MEAFLGIDVSKGYADFTLLASNKTELEKVFQLDDTRAGHDALKTVLEQQKAKHQISTLYCAVESTGGFENNWYSGLITLSKTMNLKVARLNPGGVQKNIAAGLNRNITDALSSRYIAEYLISHADKVEYSEQSSYYADFRSLTRHIQLQTKQQTQLINQLKMLLYSSFPEMLCYCRRSTPNWILETLSKYPTAAVLKKCSIEKLAKIKHVTAEKARSLLEKAKTGVASRNSEAQAFLIKRLAGQIIEKQEVIEECKKYLEKNCKGKEADLLKTITGIGAYSAAAIMVEIEDIKRFASPKQLVSYFGLHPELKDSGDKKSVYHLSKKGRPFMRSLLYMCAQTAVIYDEHFKAIYHRHRSKGMKHSQALGVIMQKMLRVIWGVLTHKEPYQSDIDKQNQAKVVTAVKKDGAGQEMKVKRRYNSLTTEAPVSSRQNKKRKVHLESQVELVEHARDHLKAPVVKI